MSEKDNCVDIAVPRILFHAVNQIGLGHLSRLIAIALAIRERAPYANLLFTVDGSSHGLLEAAYIPYMALPYLRGLQKSSVLLTKGKEQLVFSAADSVIKIMRPNLLVFDCFPDGLLFRAARQNEVPIALIMRKMKDMANLLKEYAGFVDNIDLILAPHEPGEIDIPEEYVAKTRYVGTIARPFPTKPTKVIDFDPNIVISGGGGGYPGTVDFYNATLEAFNLCRHTNPTLSGLLVTGPLFQEWNQLRPVEGVRIIPFENDISSLFRTADVVVCQAGYNTIAEIVSLQTPAICIPAQRSFDDQYERAASIASIHPQIQLCVNLDPLLIAKMMLDALQMPKVCNAPVRPPTGAKLAAEYLLTAADGFQSTKPSDRNLSIYQLSGD